jgi:hypothetical protein
MGSPVALVARDDGPGTDRLVLEETASGAAAMRRLAEAVRSLRPEERLYVELTAAGREKFRVRAAEPSGDRVGRDPWPGRYLEFEFATFSDFGNLRRQCCLGGHKTAGTAARQYARFWPTFGRSGLFWLETR